MSEAIFTTESQIGRCDDFMRRLDTNDYVPTDSLQYIVREVEKTVANVALRTEVIYAHLMLGGEPLLAVPFINEANPANLSIPLSHKKAAHMTARRYDLPNSENDYWSLYVLRPKNGEQVYGVTWLSAATNAQLLAVKQMLQFLPRFQLFTAQTHSRGTTYIRVQSRPQ